MLWVIAPLAIILLITVWLVRGLRQVNELHALQSRKLTEADIDGAFEIAKQVRRRGNSAYRFVESLFVPHMGEIEYALFMNEYGDPVEGLAVVEPVIAGCRRKVIRALAMSVKGLLLRTLDRRSESEQVLREALEYGRKMGMPNDHVLGGLRLNLAHTLHAGGRFAEAEELVDQSPNIPALIPQIAMLRTYLRLWEGKFTDALAVACEEQPQPEVKKDVAEILSSYIADEKRTYSSIQWLLVAMVAREMGDTKNGLASVKRARKDIRINPILRLNCEQNRAVLSAMASAKEDALAALDEVERWREALSRNRTAQWEAAYHTARTWRVLGDRAKAREFIEKALAIEVGPLMRHVALHEAGVILDSRDHFRQCADLGFETYLTRGVDKK